VSVVDIVVESVVDAVVESVVDAVVDAVVESVVDAVVDAVVDGSVSVPALSSSLSVTTQAPKRGSSARARNFLLMSMETSFSVQVWGRYTRALPRTAARFAPKIDTHTDGGRYEARRMAGLMRARGR
jgi:hypothetical protein